MLYSLPRNLKSDIEVLGGLIDTKDGLRVFSQSERKKLSFSCQGDIIGSINESLLTMEELENVLAEAVQLETEEVGLCELEQILFKVVNDQERLLMISPSSNRGGVPFFT